MADNVSDWLRRLRLERVDQQHPVDRIIREGELSLMGQGDQISLLRGPAEHTEHGRHQRHRALRLGRHRRKNAAV